MAVKDTSSRDFLFKSINTKFGAGSIGTLDNDERAQILHWASTGIYELDDATGWGLPGGRIVEYFGAESCLSGKAKVLYETHYKDGSSHCDKASLAHFFEVFHRHPTGKGRPRRYEDIVGFSMACANEEGRITHNDVVDVVDTGDQECFCVTTESGLKLVATAEHRFFTGQRYTRLKHLSAGDTVYIHNNTRFTVGAYKKAPWRSEISVLHHPVAGDGTLTDRKTGKVYAYKSLALSRALVEAEMNHMTLGEYRLKLDQGELDGLRFLTREQHVHHVDEDITNNSMSNLEVISASAHGVLHATERHNNLRFMVVPDTIVEIHRVGMRHTYDVKMATPYHNYVANHFVVHNSGKTTALMAAMIENARRGGINVMFDAEGTFDLDRYQQMGGDPSDVIMVDPGTMEEFYDKLKHVVTWATKQDIPKDSVVLIGVDSMPMLLTQKMMDLEGDDQLVAEQSRVNSRHLGTIDKELGSNTCLLLLNQVRDKIGGMAWNADGNIDTPGGRIIKHLCSIRVLFNKQGQIDNGKSKEARVIVGMKTGAKVVKNKVAPPLRKVEFRIMFDERGVDNVFATLQAMVKSGWVSNPVKGVYTIKHVKKELTCKAEGFAAFLNTHPKWCCSALKGTFELEHPSLDLNRYLGKTSVEDDGEDDD